MTGKFFGQIFLARKFSRKSPLFCQGPMWLTLWYSYKLYIGSIFFRQNICYHRFSILHFLTHGSISLTIFHHNSNPMENCCYSMPGHQITTKFCTWHDNCAVISCAKFCSDHFEFGWDKKFHWIVLLMENIISIMGPLTSYYSCSFVFFLLTSEYLLYSSVTYGDCISGNSCVLRVCSNYYLVVYWLICKCHKCCHNVVYCLRSFWQHVASCPLHHYHINSLTPGKFGSNLRLVILKQTSRINIYCEIALRWTSQDLSDD